MIVKVRRMGGNIAATDKDKTFIAKPEGWDQKGVFNTLKRAFTLKYEVFDEMDLLVSQVEYNSLENQIIIRKKSGNVAIDLPTFCVNSTVYHIREKMTGLLVTPVQTTDDSSTDTVIAIEATKSLTEFSMEFTSSDENMHPILKEFAIGIMIRWMSYLY